MSVHLADIKIDAAVFGHLVKQAKVGFMIQGPDNAKQKKMCMAMGGGFGADINFKAKGVYTVMVKVVAGDKNLMDKFGCSSATTLIMGHGQI